MLLYRQKKGNKQMKEERRTKMKNNFYIEFTNGVILKGLTELEMYKTLYLGKVDENGIMLKVECYGEMF